MKSKIMPKDGNEESIEYKFRINDDIDLEITGTAIPVLRFDSLPTNKQIEDLMKKLLNKKSGIKKILIDSNVCRADDEIVFQTNELTIYEKENSIESIK